MSRLYFTNESVSVVATNAYLVLKFVFIGSLTVCCPVHVADADAQLLLRLCDSQSRHHLQRRTWRGKLKTSLSKMLANHATLLEIMKKEF